METYLRALKLKLSVNEIKVPLRVTAKIEVLVSKPVTDEADLRPSAKQFLTPYDRELSFEHVMRANRLAPTYVQRKSNWVPISL